MASFFSSDTHFGSEAVIQCHHRPFNSATEMDTAILTSFQQKISANDTLYHCGDFSDTEDLDYLSFIFQQIPGRKILIAGNHDNNVRKLGWDEVHDILEIKLNHEQKLYHLILCHYPIEEWNQRWKGSLHIHGHTHGRSDKKACTLDVGIDCWGGQPVSLEMIFQHIEIAPPTQYQFSAHRH